MPSRLVHGRSQHRAPLGGTAHGATPDTPGPDAGALRGAARRRRSLGVLTATAAAVLATGGAQAMAAVPSAATPTPPPTACSGVIRIDGLAFNPAVIPPGQSSTATLYATNCTGQTQSVSETWAGTWISSTTTGVPAGCPVIDPLSRSAAFAPYSSVATATTYLVFPGCTADGLKLTVTLSGPTGVYGQVSATLRIVQPSTG